MATVTHKQRDFLERDKRILHVARQIFRRRGYLGLNMDRVAREMQYAKGTIYLHFANKEEILLAMAIETLDKRTAMFERAVCFNGCARERMAAVGCAAELFVKWYPDHFELEKVLSSNSIIEKTCDKLQQQKVAAELKCIALVGGVVREAIAQGDLALPDHVTPDQIVFGLWSSTFGGYSILESAETIRQMGIADGFQMVRDSNNRLLDGYGWKPLSTEFDFNETFAVAADQLFSDGRGLADE